MQMRNELIFLSAVCAWWPVVSPAQDPDTLRQILERLGRLEQENRSLRGELAEVKSELATLRVKPSLAGEPRLEERLEIQERRVEEQAQTKVEASQRFPVRLTGMAVVNLFHNGSGASGLDTPTTASRAPGRAAAGASFRQSVVGLEYHGPTAFWGARVSGSLFLDFFEGQTEYSYNPARIRTASFELAWKSRSVLVGIEKPLFSPRNPNSYSYLGIAPLTASGNLWSWQPQIRFEQRLAAGSDTQIRAQAALFQTSEESGVAAEVPAYLIERRRPGIQGRLEFSRKLDDTRRVEVAPAFHFSTSHIGRYSIPSSLFSLDWFANPWRKLEFSGAFFAGRNIAHFGALRQGYSLRNRDAIPVRSRGGWGQFTIPFTERVSLNLFGGVHDDRNSDLAAGGIASNRSGAVNLMYRLAPNVVVSLEALRMSTRYLGSDTRTNHRYDLAVAYLF